MKTNICACIFISQEQITSISKVTINKLKDVLGFCGKLVLISIMGRRALKVIIKCFLNTEAGTTHSLLENNFLHRLRNHREKFWSH